jgi:UrcA family protein
MDKGFKIAAAAFLVTAALLKAVPAFAQMAPAPVNVSIVHTADLDLTSDSGKRQLDQRLARAAREVCGAASDADLEGKNDVRACRADVLSKAKAESTELAGRGAPMTIAAGR